MGAAKQEPVIKDVLSKFFKLVGVDAPEDKNEAIKIAINLIRKAQRNYIMLKFIKDMYEALGELM